MWLSDFAHVSSNSVLCSVATSGSVCCSGTINVCERVPEMVFFTLKASFTVFAVLFPTTVTVPTSLSTFATMFAFDKVACISD